MSRAKCIALIDAANKRKRFLEVYGRSPEDYFEEYAYLEPGIWYDVLNDLSIEV